jgi:hypothetical protein
MTLGRLAAAVALRLFALCLLAVGSSNAAASPIQLDFVADPTVPGPGGPYPGTPVPGSLSFDPAALIPSLTQPGVYSFGAGEGLLHVSGVPPLVSDTLLESIRLQDGPGGDSWATGTSIPPGNPPGYLIASFVLSDPTGSALSSTDYVTPESLAPWTGGGTLSLTFYPRGQSPINYGIFTITELSLAAPEPASAATVALALCLLGARRAFAR